MSTTTRSTAGSGYEFEDLVAADLLSRFLNDLPIRGIGVPGVRLLSQVGALRWAIDDLLCIGVDPSGQERKLALSCKSNLQVSGRGLPADYMAAAWSLWSAPGRFDRETDRMALVTRGRHTGFDALWHDIKGWCEGGDHDLAMARIDASAKHRRVFDSVHDPGTSVGGELTTAETIALIGRIDVYPVDLQLTPSDTADAARDRCRAALASARIDEAEALWNALIQRAKDARLGNGTTLLAELLHSLGGTFALKTHPSVSAAWTRLLAFAADHCAEIDTNLPNGHVVARLTETAKLRVALQTDRGCVVIGDSGVGKSALVRRVLNDDFAGALQIWLGPETLAASLSGADRLGIGLDHPLARILERGPSGDKFLVLDAVERLDAASVARLDMLLGALPRDAAGGSSWRCILVSQSAGIDEQIGRLVNAAARPRITVGELGVEEVEHALRSVPSLRWIADDEDVLPVLANLKTLGWVIGSASSFIAKEAGAFASAPAIADRLWVRWTGGRAQLKGLMIRLAIRDAAFERGVAVSRLDSGDNAAIDARPYDAPLIVDSRNRVTFQHDLASDWARYQHLKEIADDVPAWASLAPQPLWIAALRLFGQFLLAEPDQARNGWDRAFAAVSASGHADVADLLLDALCLDPKLDRQLAARTELFFAEGGALLLRLFHRFVHVASTPNMPAAAIDPALRIYLEADMRLPIIARWVPMSRFLAAYSERVAGLGAPIVARICSLWLNTMPEKIGEQPMLLRDIMARLALETARTAQIQSIARSHYGGGGDAGKSVYTAALAGAADLPAEVAAFALEMARRRPLAEASGTRREDLPPWPLGPFGRLNGAFRESVLRGHALTPLMRHEPATASEVLLACIVNDQPSRDYGSSKRLHDDLGLEFDQESRPTIFWKSPFFVFLSLQPEDAIAAIGRLLDFAMERWAADAPQDARIPYVEVTLADGGKRRFRGNTNQFGWSQQNSTSSGQLFAALDALERWLVLKINAGEDISIWCRRLLDLQCSTAILGLLVNLGKHQPALFAGPLESLLAIKALYRWDDGRVRFVGQNFDVFSWHRMGEAISTMAHDWVLAPHRRTPLRAVAADLAANDAELALRLTGAAARWSVPDDPKAALEQRILRAELDPANRRSVIDEESGEIRTGIAYPPELAQALADWEREAATTLTPVTLPYQCERILAGTQDLDEQSAAYLAELLPPIDAPIPDTDEARRMSAAAASTLLAKGGEWLHSQPELVARAHHVVRLEIARIGDTRADMRGRDSIGSDEALRFTAIGALHAALESAQPSEWDRALVTVLTARDMGAIGGLMREAERNRDRLGSAWYRLNHLLIMSAGLDHLAPRFDEDDDALAWDRWLERLRSQPLFGHCTDPASIDPVGLALRVERLLRSRSAREDGEVPIRLTGRGRRFAGLSWHVLQAGYAWLLDHERAVDIAASAENRTLVARLWAFEAWRMEGEADDDDEHDLPSELGYAILRMAPAIILACPADEPEPLWRSILSLGPDGHYAVDQFARCWFLALFKNVDPDRFMAEWTAMLRFAFAADWRGGRRWYRGRALFATLLGLHASTELAHVPAVRDRSAELMPFQRRWATEHMVGDETDIETFCYFLTTEAGRPLRMEGVVWLDVALAASARLERGTGNAIAEALDVVLSQHAAELVSTPASRDAMIAITARLVRAQVGPAMGLQRRIAALR